MWFAFLTIIFVGKRAILCESDAACMLPYKALVALHKETAAVLVNSDKTWTWVISLPAHTSCNSLVRTFCIWTEDSLV